MSKPSLESVAAMGLDLMCTGGTSVATMIENTELFNGVRRSVGLPPTRPIIAVPGYCAATEDEATDVASRAFGGYIDGSRRHYGLDNPQQFAGIKGYEQYAPGGAGTLRGGDSPRDDYLLSGVFGTPDQCIKKIQMYVEATGTDHLLMLHSVAGMSVGESERSLRLFSREVLPVVRAAAGDAGSVAVTAPVAATT